jgi:hypothetical protein
MFAHVYQMNPHGIVFVDVDAQRARRHADKVEE